VRYAAQFDAEGKTRGRADGHFVKGENLGYVMEKRTGWGGEYLASQRNGEWEYRVFTPHKTPNTSIEHRAHCLLRVSQGAGKQRLRLDNAPALGTYGACGT
jgi:hypothetical protein